MGRPLAPPPPVYVEVAPPRPRPEFRPPRPSPGTVWIGGYWGWDNGAHIWIGGEWAAPPAPGYVWAQPRWRRHGHRWGYQQGYWRHTGGPVYVDPEYAQQPEYAGPAYPPPPPAYAGNITISGHATTSDGAPVPGVMVTLAGSQEGRVVTDNSGYYVFGDLPPGSYSVRPTGGGCAFAPDVVNLNNLRGSVTQDIVVSGCPGW
jgi:hypothetical protein